MKNVIKLCFCFLCLKSSLLMAGFSLYELPGGGICLVFTIGEKTVRESMTSGAPIQVFLYSQNDEQREKFETLGGGLDEYVLQQLQLAINEKDSGEVPHWERGRFYRIEKMDAGLRVSILPDQLPGRLAQRPVQAQAPVLVVPQPVSQVPQPVSQVPVPILLDPSRSTLAGQLSLVNPFSYGCGATPFP